MTQPCPTCPSLRADPRETTGGRVARLEAENVRHNETL